MDSILVSVLYVLVQQHLSVKLDILEVVFLVIDDMQLVTNHLIEPAGRIVVKSQVPPREYRMPLGVRHQYRLSLCRNTTSRLQFCDAVDPDRPGHCRLETDVILLHEQRHAVLVAMLGLQLPQDALQLIRRENPTLVSVQTAEKPPRLLGSELAQPL